MATPPFDLCMSHTKAGTPAMFRSSLVCKLQDSRGPRFARHHKMKPRSRSNDVVFVEKKRRLPARKMCNVDELFSPSMVKLYIVGFRTATFD